MPSLRIVFKSLALTSLLAVAIAAPVRHEEEDACAPHHVSSTVVASSTATTAIASSITTKVVAVSTTSSAVVTPSATASATPTIPASGANPDLNNPDLSLQFVAIGRGVQNYTCTGAGSNSTLIGAIATLFDATDIAYANEAMLHTLPPMMVNLPVESAGSIQTAAKKINLDVLGHHFFTADGTPTFDLTDEDSKILYAAKVMGVKAPADASKGPLGTGAVDWLQLKAKATYPSVGLGEVYRVETAGGNPTACQSAGGFSIPYAAEYWFYA
ncbi:hypothetical protein BGZ60DRAFT_466529 [Tricladium varicosporioides]|nr:hypothetical protein BGZ60DRAFT_466529 [Hymenoscyphus varicosporioides]